MQTQIRLIEVFVGVYARANKKAAGVVDEVLFKEAQKLNILRKQLAIVQESRRIQMMGGFEGAPSPGGTVLAPEPIPVSADKGDMFKDTQTLEFKKELFAQEVEAIRTTQEQERMIKATYAQWDLDQEQQLADETIKIHDGMFSDVEYLWDGMSNKQKQVMRDTLSNTKFAFAEFGKQSKAAFEVFKAISIAETVINTYKAAQGAYSAMASIPYIGPALGVAAAAAAVAAGMARVSAINSMSPGGGASGVSGGGTYMSPMITAPATPALTDTAQSGPKIEIHIHGDYFDSLESRQSIAGWLTEYVEQYGGTLVASEVTA